MGPRPLSPNPKSTPLNKEEKEKDMDLAGFIDSYKDAIAQRVVESYPPLYRPSENGHKLPRCCCDPPWERRRTP